MYEVLINKNSLTFFGFQIISCKVYIFWVMVFTTYCYNWHQTRNNQTERRGVTSLHKLLSSLTIFIKLLSKLYVADTVWKFRTFTLTRKDFVKTAYNVILYVLNSFDFTEFLSKSDESKFAQFSHCARLTGFLFISTHFKVLVWTSTDGRTLCLFHSSITNYCFWSYRLLWSTRSQT